MFVYNCQGKTWAGQANLLVFFCVSLRCRKINLKRSLIVCFDRTIIRFECIAVMCQCVGTARSAVISLPLKCCRRELVKWSYPLPYSPRGSFLFDLAETGAFQSTTCLPYEMLWLTVKACQLRFNRSFFCNLKGPRQALNCCNVAWHNRHSFTPIIYQLSSKIKLNVF